MKTTDAHSNAHALETYYRWHARFYDATRWSFLFGRKRLLQNLPDLPAEPRILEIGCGTGENIKSLGRLFPDAHITGMDLSAAMLKWAAQKTNHIDNVTLLHETYGSGQHMNESYDLILLSYSLTMMDENTALLISQSTRELTPAGHVAVVDFFSTPFRWFQRWMNANHVRVDGTHPALLDDYYKTVRFSTHEAYFGLWRYFMFVGRPV